MKSLLINAPIPISVVDDGATYEGQSILKTTNTKVQTSVSILRRGEILKDVGDKFGLKTFFSHVGGKHGVRSEPDMYGVMPRAFSRPHQFIYTYDPDNVTSHTWIGQSDKGVKKYYGCSFTGQYGNNNVRAQDNVRLFSFKGDLYALTDTWKAYPKYSRRISIYKYSFDTEQFTLAYRFDKPVDELDNNNVTEEEKASLQYGSPDWVIYDDELFIFFRVVNRNLNSNKVVGYKTSDLVDWTQVTEFEVEDSFDDIYDRFRLRVATGNEMIMLVYYGTARHSSLDSIEGDYQEDDIEFKDMRSYVSFDGGYSFETKQKNIRGIIEGNNSSFKTVRGGTGMHSLFIPEFLAGSDERDYVDFNVNFDLYFDEVMGSFVVLKAGDPPGKDINGGTDLPQYNETYLMGIKTTAQSVFDWELCLQLKVDNSMSGIALFSDKGDKKYFDAFAEDSASNTTHTYMINDVCIVPDRGINTLILGVYELDDTNSVPTNGAVVTEFKFIEKGQIPPGYYDKLYAYGVKNHSDYSFIGTLINAEQNSLVSIGHKHTTGGIKDERWTGIASCKYRNQITAMAKQTGAGKTYNFLTVLGPWSNLGETIPYQHSYCRRHCAMSSWEWAESETGSGTVDYVSGWNKCEIGASSDTAFLHTTYTSNLNPNVPRRAGNSSSRDLKVKFTLKAQNLPTNAETKVLEVRDSSEEGIGKIVSLKIGEGVGGNGDAQLVFGTGSQGIDCNFDWTQAHDILLKIGSSFEQASDVISLWMKPSSEDDWVHYGDFDNNVYDVETGLGTPPYVRIGIVEADSYAGQIVEIGDVFLGSGSDLYRQPFVENKRDEVVIEGACKGDVVSAGYTTDDHIARPVMLNENEVELKDGTKLRFTGGPSLSLGGVDYTLQNTKTRNTEVNLTNGFAASVFDMTNQYDVTNGLEVIFRNENRMRFDSISFVNVSGVTGFDIQVGTYDEDDLSWTHTVVEEYTWPYKTLSISTSEDNILRLSSEDFVAGEIAGYTILSHDGTDNVQQYTVVDNYDDIIELDQTIGDITGLEFRLMAAVGTFDVPDAIENTNLSHFSVTFYGPINATNMSVGEVVVGNLIDLSDYVSELNMEIDSSFDLAESEFGHVFDSNLNQGALLEFGSLVFQDIGNNDDGFDFVFNLVNHLFNRHKPFPIVIADNENALTTYYALVNGGFNTSPSNYLNTVELPLVFQDWLVETNTEVENEAPILEISADDVEPNPGQTVVFTANATDPAGESLTYSWDFGNDDTGSTDSDSTTYSDLGDYLVSCTVTNESGLSTTKKMRVYVVEAWVDYYTISASSTSGIATGTAVTITVTGYDKDDNVVTKDNESVLLFEADGEPPHGFDANGDTTFSYDLDDIRVQMDDGVATIEYKQGIPATVTISFVDQMGRQGPTIDLEYV